MFELQGNKIESLHRTCSRYSFGGYLWSLNSFSVNVYNLLAITIISLVIIGYKYQHTFPFASIHSVRQF